MSQQLAMVSGSGVSQLYVDDVFSTYLYTGNGSSQTITNGINLSGSGGMVWIKSRSNGSTSHELFDTARGPFKFLCTDSTSAAGNSSPDGDLTGFTSSGFQLGTAYGYANSNGQNYTSWTFRKAAKFFDVVTYTGNGANRTISHNLGAVPGLIIIKRTDGTTNWETYHRSTGATKVLRLNSTTAAIDIDATYWNNTEPTSSVFSLGTYVGVNADTATYVAYLFAHDTTTDGLIQCGSYTGTGSAGSPTVSLGWEPQYLMVKRSSGGTGGWVIFDTARGLNLTSGNYIDANTANPEYANNMYFNPTATGFVVAGGSADHNANGSTYIYLAIRRPNKPVTSGTQVYNAIARTGTGAAATVTGVGFAPDLLIAKKKTGTGLTGVTHDRLRGASLQLANASTAAEYNDTTSVTAFGMDGVSMGTDNPYNNAVNYSTWEYINWFFRRAPGVFDVVCYTGTGSATTVAHSLGVVPELMIVKRRNSTGSFNVYVSALGATKWMYLNSDNGPTTTSTVWNDTAPTASVFTVGSSIQVNENAGTYICYLFASKAGISKVGSYTGNGSTQTINCGFSAGARFVLIKRTDSNGDWYVFDTTRGLIAGNDPFLKLNSTAAEATTYDAVDPDNSGFVVNNDATNFPINVNGASYIYLSFS